MGDLPENEVARDAAAAAAPPLPEDAPMDIHKPKPVHNLREFLSEITVIVIGVLIALGLEQAVEAWHWYHQVETTEQALRADLLETYDTAADRIAITGCLEHRLDEIAAIVDQAGATGRLPPIGRLGSPPNFVGSQATWESALAGQTAEHLSVRRRRAYAAMYSFDARMIDDNKRESEAWNALYTLVGPGRAVTPAEIANWRADVGRARQESETMALLSVRFQQLIDSSPLAKDHKPYSATSRSMSAACQPIGPAPAHYGSSLFVDGIAHARQAPITSDFPKDP
ncbi:hypothetical protein ACLB0R_05900 [Sphingomonas sp. GlSt437]|uniref:hypothetical protein n=1 Tax=Sphingomonas sp. GlSt437 TaxID=3389970 RepID=UPI003A8C551B